MEKAKEKTYFNWLKFTKLYFGISALVIGMGIYAVAAWGIPLGLDFTGGAVVDYETRDSEKIAAIEEKLKSAGIEVKQTITSSDRVSIKTTSLEEEKQEATESVALEVGVERVQIQNVGPIIGPELVKKTAFAILIASVSILLWVAIQFKRLNFGISAILAMLHDSLILIGVFSIFGKFFGAEIDFLFVTALLTTLSFSVHDTIVVFDRVREIQKKHGGEIERVANRAISETMRRSIINSLTIIMMLVALVVLGGDSVRWFAVALLVGAISGTYSSPFVAVPLFVTFDRLQKRLKRK